MTTTDVSTAIFIDTNVLIRYTIGSAPLHIESQRVVNYLWANGAEMWISRQVIREYAAVLSRPQTYTTPLRGSVIAHELRTFQNNFSVADDTIDVTDRLLVLIENIPVGGKQIHDANIVATMQAYGIGRLLTLNVKDFSRFTQQITLLTLENVLQQIDNSDE